LLLRVSPLSGHPYQDAHPIPFRFVKDLRRLYLKIFDEKIRHARFEIIEQILQGGLTDFQTFGEADKALRGARPLQIDLGGQDIAARSLDRGLDGPLQSRTRDGDGLSTRERRAIDRGARRTLQRCRALQLPIEMSEHFLAGA